MSLGNRIKEVRTNYKMTQQEFAEKLSVSRSFISRVEADKEKPSDSLLKLISATFNIRLGWLMTGDGQKESEKQATLKFLEHLELPDELFLEESEKEDFAKWSGIMLCMVKKAGLKSNSERYYRFCIKHILSILNYVFSENNSEWDIETLKGWSGCIEQKMEEALKAFKQEDLDEIYF